MLSRTPTIRKTRQDDISNITGIPPTPSFLNQTNWSNQQTEVPSTVQKAKVAQLTLKEQEKASF
jgi:hypothetical protein